MTQHHPDAFLKKVRRIGKMFNMLAAVSPALAGRLAFRLFCSPRRLRVREQDERHLAAARQETLTLAGHSIRTYTWPAEHADAPRVLLLHGWESNSARWHKYLKPLQEAGFAVCALDAPAHGHSGGRLLNLILYSRVVKAYMAERGLPYALVGHSLGGAAIVMSMTVMGAPHATKAVIMGVFAESSRVIRDFGAILQVTPAVVQSVHREILRRTNIPVEDYSVQRNAGLLKDVQGLVLHDRDDEVAPVDEGRAIAETWGVPFVETQGLGHRMQDKSVVKAVVDFLRY